MIVFVSGKYSSPTQEGIAANIAHAEAVARRLWAAGFAVICPHSNSAYYDDSATYNQFLAGYLEMIPICDAVIALSNWEDSPGSQVELRRAEELYIPVFHEHVLDSFIEEYQPRLARMDSYQAIANHGRRMILDTLYEGETKYPHDDLHAIIDKPDTQTHLIIHAAMMHDLDGEDHVAHITCRGAMEGLRRFML